MARTDRGSVPHGRRHARFRLRRALEFAPVVPDQGDGRTRRPGRASSGTAGLTHSHAATPFPCAKPAIRQGANPHVQAARDTEHSMTEAIKTDVLIIGAGP